MTDDSVGAQAPVMACAACGEPVPADAWACPSCGTPVVAETGLEPGGHHRERRRSSGGDPRSARSGSRRSDAHTRRAQRTVKLRMTPAAAVSSVLGIAAAIIAAFLLGMAVAR